MQIHIHVNGDAGLDRVLNALEKNTRRNPRFNHRTTIVHFAVSAKDQVARIKQLGCLVSGNPYYVTSLADNYSKVGLGPQRESRTCLATEAPARSHSSLTSFFPLQGACSGNHRKRNSLWHYRSGAISPEEIAIQKTSLVRRASCTVTEVLVEREFKRRR
jgi:hypothetical protein